MLDSISALSALKGMYETEDKIIWRLSVPASVFPRLKAELQRANPKLEVENDLIRIFTSTGDSVLIYSADYGAELIHFALQ